MMPSESFWLTKEASGFSMSNRCPGGVVFFKIGEVYQALPTQDGGTSKFLPGWIAHRSRQDRSRH